VEHLRLVILDRDGVINQDSDAYIKAAAEWLPIPGSLDAIARLTQNGWQIVVATNQSGIARGLFDLDELVQMHQKMCRLVSEAGGHIDAIFYCPSADDHHLDRKPKPGMLLDLAQRLQCRLDKLIMVGDTARDIAAAKAVGATPMLVKTGKGERTLQAWQDDIDFPVFADLSEAADYIISKY
jgi:D-glycero-D-manno-heptose 1,7-bisphosphate phosphatase